MEVINFLVGVLAVFISTVALVRSRKAHQQAMKYEKIAAELNQKYLDQISKDESERYKASLFVELNVSGACGEFLIINKGDGTANKIWFSLAECAHNPLSCDDYELKNPYSKLNAGESYTLEASFDLHVPLMVYPVVVRWENEDGTQGRFESSLSR